MTDYADWQTPQAHADRIAATGVPLLHDATVVNQGTFNFAAVPDSHATGNLSIRGICHELLVFAENFAPSGSPSYLTVQMDWTDSTSGLLVARRKFKVAGGQTGSPHSFKIAGPVHADTVKVTFGLTADSTNLMGVTYVLLGTSRLYARDVIRSTIPKGDSYTLAGTLPEYDVLTATAPTVASLASAVRLLPAYSGLIHVACQTASNTTDMITSVVEAHNGQPVLPNFQTIFTAKSDASGFTDATFMLPGIECTLNLTNLNAGSKVLSAHVAIVEPAS